MSKTYGITEDSVLNLSNYFHIIDGLPPDIMHDILEGSLQYEVKEFLKHLILHSNYLTLETLNVKIQRFPYQQSDKTNKPTQIKESVLSSSTHSLKQEGKDL